MARAGGLKPPLTSPPDIRRYRLGKFGKNARGTRKTRETSRKFRFFRRAGEWGPIDSFPEASGEGRPGGRGRGDFFTGGRPNAREAQKSRPDTARVLVRWPSHHAREGAKRPGRPRRDSGGSDCGNCGNSGGSYVGMQKARPGTPRDRSPAIARGGTRARCARGRKLARNRIRTALESSKPSGGTTAPLRSPLHRGGPFSRVLRAVCRISPPASGGLGGASLAGGDGEHTEP